MSVFSMSHSVEREYNLLPNEILTLSAAPVTLWDHIGHSCYMSTAYPFLGPDPCPCWLFLGLLSVLAGGPGFPVWSALPNAWFLLVTYLPLTLALRSSET
jgi:hypothetical protein